jgi:phosphoribosylformylglycinamidine synthase
VVVRDADGTEQHRLAGLTSVDRISVARDGSVTAFSRPDTVIASIDLDEDGAGPLLRAGKGAGRLDEYGEGTVVASDTVGDTLLVYSTSPIRLHQQFPVAAAPWAVAGDPTRDVVWVTSTGTNTVQAPGTSAAVLRIRGGKKGLAAATDCNSRYCKLDPREGTIRAVTEAARNVACTGAKPAAVTNCLNFPSPEKPQQYWALGESIQGMAQACLALNTPVIGGNVSLYNESVDVAINPTPVIGMVGLLDDVEKTCTISPQGGQTLVLLGEIQPLPGGSEYLLMSTGNYNGPVPQVNLKLEAALCRLLPQAIGQGLITAAHDVSEGGIAVTLAEMAMASQLGLEVAVPESVRPDYWLFSESPGAVVAAVDRNSLEELKELAKNHNVPLITLGQVTGDTELCVTGLLRLSIPQLREVWNGTLLEVFGGE